MRLAQYLVSVGCLVVASMVAGEDGGPRQPTAMQIYESNFQGRILFRAEQYEEAYEHLVVPAMFGIKTAQAQIGIMHMHGLGGLEADPTMIIGWLGVATEGFTDRKYKQAFKDAWDQVPDGQRPAYQRVIDRFVSIYGSKTHGVKCSRKKHFRSRVAEFDCFFEDERYGIAISDPYAAIRMGAGELDEQSLRALRGLENDGLGGTTGNIDWGGLEQPGLGP